MRTTLWVAAITFCCSLGSSQSRTANTHPKTSIDCSTCHSCIVPTKANPCLKNCPRAQTVTVHHPADETPEILILDAIAKPTDLYKPVVFTHRAHAKMTEMSGNCSLCHHYNPPGAVLPCKECHESNSAVHRTDLARPGLKGAYHRQCLGCHRQWSHSTQCEGCHELHEGKTSAAVGPPVRPEFPSILRPARFVYETASPHGKFVTFNHDNHIRLFGLSCTDCHREEPCTSCHEAKAVGAAGEHSSVDREQKCYSCHTAKGNCSNCHNNEPRDSFSHFSRTGFALAGYHGRLSCSECHRTKNNFKGLDRNCTSCHTGWQSGSFNHETTGLVLDDPHAEVACEDCHLKNDFTAKPTCSNCHEDKSFPKDRPGKLLRKK